MSVAEEKSKSITGIIKRIKGIKHIEIIIALIAVAIMLLIYFSGFSGSGNNNSAPDTTTARNFYSDYCSKMQAEITKLVSDIKGAGNSTVVVSWESSVELIIAASENSNSNTSSTSPIVINNSGSSSPIILKEIYPKALGVLVVCKGGSDAKIRVSIIIGISTLLNISSDKIVVCEGKG